MTMNERSTRSTVVGVFPDHDSAREAIEALKDAGFEADSIGLLAHDRAKTRELAEDTGTKSHVGEGVATGLVAGGILGGLGGWLVGIGALAIPGVGPFIAAGALGAALTGAAVGAGVGAIAGALVGMGVPEDEAKYYEGEVREGRTLVTVKADGRYADARRILREHGAYDIEDRGTDAGTRGYATSSGVVGSPTLSSDRAEDTRGASTMQLREEELRVQKESVETGRVSVGKEVTEERRTVNVPVTHEEVTIERHPVDRRPSDQPIRESERSINVPVRAEQVDVEKKPVVYEEVTVGTREVTESQPVSATVRREEARIEGDQDVNVRGNVAGGRGWDQAMSGYRQRWQERYGSSGGRWEDYEPSYRYGYEMRERPEYRGRRWAEAEPELQRDWSRRNPNTPWERAKEAIRETWEEVRH